MVYDKSSSDYRNNIHCIFTDFHDILHSNWTDLGKWPLNILCYIPYFWFHFNKIVRYSLESIYQNHNPVSIKQLLLYEFKNNDGSNHYLDNEVKTQNTKKYQYNTNKKLILLSCADIFVLSLSPLVPNP